MPNPLVSFDISKDQPTARFTIRLEHPVAKVWRALTEPDLLPRWYGPAKYPTIESVGDPVVGEVWRIKQGDGAGAFWQFYGQWLEIVPMTRLKQTWIWSGEPEVISVSWYDIEHADGVTTLDGGQTFPSMEAAGAHEAAGAEKGFRESLERLDVLLASI